MSFNRSSTGMNLFMNDICTFLLAALADELLYGSTFMYGTAHFVQYYSRPSSYSVKSITQADLTSKTIVQSVVHIDPSLNQGYTINILLGASSFINLAATLSGTLLISHRIHAVSEEDLRKSSRRLFRQVLEILVQSAAAYVIITLAYSIPVVVSYTPNNATSMFTAQGVAPTIMVARAADTKRDISTVGHISDIRLHVPSTNPNATLLKWEYTDVELGTEESLKKSDSLDEKERERGASSNLQMATSRKTSARTGKVQRGHVPPEDVPAIESDTGSPAARGDSEQVPEPDHRVSGSNLTGSEVADARGRGDRRVVIDSHGKVNREAETGGAAAARPARRSNSLDSARYTPVVPEHVTGNPVLQDARQENSSSMERTTQHTEESPEPQNGSSSKGKGFDPRNWGNAGIPEIERDLDMQRALHAQVKINPDHVVHNTTNDTDSESDDDEYNKLKELE
ncbi:hypothetical protein CPB84DRAFT_1965874 [Gymnopilus junonius]|uniref:Uncharacterized protein n=1 Tax=Gymnopilus junonius TaxID=109634 RepID=A0A9P5TIE9_GYMJU|nr:hypothetical protein CPB84DRAFT_1965874 [Gymnopilus junonius]